MTGGLAGRPPSEAAAEDPENLPPPGQLRWRVREVERRTVIIEFECHDAYEAIELAEICAMGLTEGELTIEIDKNG